MIAAAMRGPSDLGATRRVHDGTASSSLGRRIRLYAAAASVKAQPTRAVPRNRGLVLAGDRLDPRERLLDPFARTLARQVAWVAHGPAIDPRPSAREVLRDVRRRVQGSQVSDEARRIRGTIGPDRDPVPSRHVTDQRHGRVTFGAPGRLGQLGANQQAGAVLHQEMPHEAELGLLAGALAEQPGRSVGDRGVSSDSRLRSP